MRGFDDISGLVLSVLGVLRPAAQSIKVQVAPELIVKTGFDSTPLKLWFWAFMVGLTCTV